MDIQVNFRIVTFGIMISQVFDVIWLYNFFTVSVIQNWISADSRHEIGLAISLANFAGKFVFGAVFWKNSIDLS